MRRRCANISTAFFSFFCFFFPVHLSVLEPLSETLVNREGFFRAASLATNIATIAMQIRLTRNTHIIYVYFSLSLYALKTDQTERMHPYRGVYLRLVFSIRRYRCSNPSPRALRRSERERRRRAGRKKMWTIFCKVKTL